MADSPLLKELMKTMEAQLAETDQVLDDLRSKNMLKRKAAIKRSMEYVDSLDQEEKRGLIQAFYDKVKDCAKEETDNDTKKPDTKKPDSEKKPNTDSILKKRTVASEHEKKGNHAFRNQKYFLAEKWYSKAIELVGWNPVTYTNRALTYMKLGHYNRAVRDCDTALNLYPKGLKALVYKAKSLYLLGDVASSEILIEEASKHHPQQKTYIMEFRNEWIEMAKKGQAQTVGNCDIATGEKDINIVPKVTSTRENAESASRCPPMTSDNSSVSYSTDGKEESDSLSESPQSHLPGATTDSSGEDTDSSGEDTDSSGWTTDSSSDFTDFTSQSTDLPGESNAAKSSISQLFSDNRADDGVGIYESEEVSQSEDAETDGITDSEDSQDVEGEEKNVFHQLAQMEAEISKLLAQDDKRTTSKAKLLSSQDDDTD